MRVELADCLVLHRRPWRETSLIVDVLSRDHGRLALMAKGARRTKSRWSGTLEPLSRVVASWQGRGDMPTLTDVQPRCAYQLADMRLMAGLYAAELVMRLCARADPLPQVFDRLIRLVDFLAADAPAIVALRFFERDLLAALGYGLDLWHTADTGEPIMEGRRYTHVADVGFVSADRHDAESVDGCVLTGLRAGRFEAADDARAARDLLRRALAPQLGDRELKSVTTARAMQRLSRQSTASEQMKESGQ